jgi:hypothetical protein
MEFLLIASLNSRSNSGKCKNGRDKSDRIHVFGICRGLILQRPLRRNGQRDSIQQERSPLLVASQTAGFRLEVSTLKIHVILSSCVEPSKIVCHLISMGVFVSKYDGRRMVTDDFIGVEQSQNACSRVDSDTIQRQSHSSAESSDIDAPRNFPKASTICCGVNWHIWNISRPNRNDTKTSREMTRLNHRRSFP